VVLALCFVHVLDETSVRINEAIAVALVVVGKISPNGHSYLPAQIVSIFQRLGLPGKRLSRDQAWRLV